MIGQTLGHYRIEARLGEGGMGVVYRALDTHLERPVAIKVLRPEAVADPERKRRFVQEAKAASALNHPNIITIYDISAAEGTDFIAMEYVRGKTLDQVVGRKGLGLREALKYAVQAADALAKAHAAGIVHRDIKPGNIMVSEDGLVKMLDFGLAKLSERAAGGDADATESFKAEAPRTEEGAILGTVAYMSPEQAEGKKLDARSDIFSFGSVLYEMLTGQRAFTGETRMSTLSAILRDDPKPVSQLAPGMPREAERIIARCLRKDPGRRFQHMDDVKIALEELKEESESGIQAPVAAPPSGPLWPWLGAAGVLMLALVVGGVLVWQRLERPTAELPGPPPRTVPFTSFPGTERDPALSPDGKQVAFAWDGEAGVNFDIYVKLVEGGTPLRLTTNPGDDRSPAWSPDGSRIAFIREAADGHGIFVIPALGGPERKLGQSAAAAGVARSFGLWSSGLAWSPDGRFLAILDKSSAQDPTSIFLLSTETGEKRKLTSPPAQHLGDGYPAFSPDGQTLAFTRAPTLEINDIYIVPVSGSGTSAGEPKRLTSEERVIWGLAWTADGRDIVFSSNRAGSQSLWKIPASGGLPERPAVGGENALLPTISRQGGRLAYTQSVADTNIWRTPGPSAKGSSGSPTKIIASTQTDVEPQFSPDGKRIVFGSRRSGYSEAWACDSDGQNPIQVTFFGGPSVGTPRWSPDSQRIAFDSTKEGQRDIYVVRAEGGSPRRLTTEASNDVRPSWSRDGRWIYFGSDRTGTWQVWKAPAEGGAAVQVTKEGGREAFESPDGKLVYYHKGQGTIGIWRVSVEGGQETLVLEQGEQGHWAILEQGLCLLNRTALPQPAIEFFNFATRRLARIAALPKEARTSVGIVPSLGVSPDGRWVLYVQADRIESDILLVENFR